MRLSLIGSLLSALVILTGAKTTSAQNPSGCYTYWKLGSCQPPGGSCSKQVPTVSPVQGAGYFYIWQNTTCCGESVLVPYEWVSQCYVAELKDPEILRRILALPGHSRFEIASCDGFLRPFPHLTVTSSGYASTQAPHTQNPLDPTFPKIF